jgi:lipoprotein-anchoring transpeptidase ErfK/SrfK
MPVASLLYYDSGVKSELSRLVKEMNKRAPLAEQPTQIYGRRPVYRPAPPPDIYVPAGEPPRRLWLPLLLIAFLLVGGAIAAAGAGFLVYRSPRIFPGVHTLGVDLGGRTEQSAATVLAANWRARSIIVDGGAGARLTMQPAELGLILDSEATASRAHAQGRDFAALPQALQYRSSEQGFPPVWYFNPEIARAALESIAPQLAVAPVDAGIALENGRVVATPSVPGRALDVAGSLSWLQQHAVEVVQQGRFPLLLTDVTPAITDSSALVAEANALLTRPLTVSLFDPVRGEQREATIAPEVWATWLALEVDPASPSGYGLDVDTAPAVAYLNEQVAALGDSRYISDDEAAAAVAQAIGGETLSLRLRLYYHERTHSVGPGETFSSIGRDYGIPYPWIQQANPGVADALRVGQTITIPSPDLLLPLPVVEHKRVVVSLSQQRLWAYENGALKWEWPVSTGIESSPTAPGVFQVQSHEENAYAGNWDLWMPKFMGIYRPVPTSEFMNGFHGFPTRNGYNLLWTNSIGRPVTYGCILVANENQALLYDWAEEGVIVEVQR